MRSFDSAQEKENEQNDFQNRVKIYKNAGRKIGKPWERWKTSQKGFAHLQKEQKKRGTVFPNYSINDCHHDLAFASIDNLFFINYYCWWVDLPAGKRKKNTKLTKWKDIQRENKPEKKKTDKSRRDVIKYIANAHV